MHQCEATNSWKKTNKFQLPNYSAMIELKVLSKNILVYRTVLLMMQFG